MSLLTRTEFEPLLNADKDGQIFVSPILDKDQIGAVSLDLRLGCEFLVSVLSRYPSITLDSGLRNGGAGHFFQTTRRDVGDTFTVHPAQTVLASSLEYIGLPDAIYADIVGRSSYNRLGIGVHSVFQPGFRGCVSLELHNHSNVPVELIVGCRLVQARFFRVANDESYFHQSPTKRKYVGQVRPTVSRAGDDKDLDILRRLKR